MFLTYDKRAFYIREDNGLILSIKQVPDSIQTAVLAGNTVTVTTDKGTYIYRQVGNTPVFNFYRKY